MLNSQHRQTVGPFTALSDYDPKTNDAYASQREHGSIYKID